MFLSLKRKLGNCLGFKDNLIYAVSLFVLIKLLMLGLTFADSLGTLFILAAIHLKTVIEYKFPKRPDLFKEMIELQEKISQLTAKVDTAQFDLNALKFGAIRK